MIGAETIAVAKQQNTHVLDLHAISIKYVCRRLWDIL